MIIININKQRTTSAKSINLDNIRKHIKYSLTNVLVKEMFTVIVLEILVIEGSSAL